MKKINYKVRSLILAVLVVVFLLGLVMTVRSHGDRVAMECDAEIKTINDNTEKTQEDENKLIKPLAKKKIAYTIFYPLTIFMLIVLIFSGVGYTYYTGKPLSSLISAVCLLTGIGLSYQYLIEFSIVQVISLSAGIVCGVIAYLVWSKIITLKDWMYYTIVALIIGFIILNIFGPKEHEGLYHWVNIGGFSVQPSEFVKILLILLAAGAYKNKKRTIIYIGAFILALGFLVFIKDFGNAVVMFATFVLSTLILWDKKLITGAIILAALIGLFFAYQTIDYVKIRIDDWTHVMEDSDAGTQQKQLFQTIILSGNKGFGVQEGAEMIKDHYAIRTDTAIAGLWIIFGRSMMIIALLGYLAIMLCSLNIPITPGSYIVVSSVCLLLASQVFINVAGSFDLIPFTGIVSPFVSAGGSNIISSYILIGLLAGSLFPKIKSKKEKTYA